MQEYILTAIIVGVCMLGWGGFIGMMIFGIDYYERRLAIFLIAIAVCGISEVIVYREYWPNQKDKSTKLVIEQKTQESK